MNEARPKKNCFACDHHELQAIQVSAPVLALVDEIEKLRTRLKECRQENNRLRGGLDVAKKMIHKEIPNVSTFRSIGPEMGWKSKTDAILELSRQIQECQKELAQLEEEKAAVAYAEENARRLSYVEKRPFWRVELERREAMGDETLVDPVTKECNELRMKLETEKSRFKKLNRETKLLLNQLQRKIDSNEEEIGLRKTCKGMIDQLLDIQSEISHTRLSWAEVKSRNHDLAKEISEYRNKIKAVQEKSRANNALIEDLAGKHKDTQKVIDSRKCIVQKWASRYEDDLREVDSVFGELTVIYEYIQNLTGEKISLVRELETLFPTGFSREQEGSVARKSIPRSEGEVQSKPKTIDILSEENKESSDVGGKEPADTEAQEADNNNPKLEKLMLQCEKYRALTEAIETETGRWVYVISVQENRLNDISQKVVETKRLIIQKTEGINKEKRLRSKKFPTSKQQQENNNIRIKVKALRDENEYLRAFLKKRMENKAKDMKICKSFILDTNNFFEDALIRYNDVSKHVPPKRNVQPKKLDEESE